MFIIDQYKIEPETKELYEHLKKYSNIKVYTSEEKFLYGEISNSSSEEERPDGVISNKFACLNFD